MKTMLILIFIVSSVAMFFGLVVPIYDDVKSLRAEVDRFDEALDKSRELRAARERLIEKRNNLDPLDVSRLEKLVPDHVDNVRLILDMDFVASNYGMRLRNVSIQRAEENLSDSGTSARSAPGSDYGWLELSFDVSASYSNLLAFLRDLERSLRIVDIVGISFQTTEDAVYTADITTRTYWLRK